MLNRFRSRVSRLRRLAGGVLLVALVARSLIPFGYMPGNLLAGEPVVLCPVASAAALALIGQHELHHHHHGSGAPSVDKSCPIGTALLLDVAVDSTRFAGLVESTPVAATVPDDVAYRVAPRQIYPARGPPLA